MDTPSNPLPFTLTFTQFESVYPFAESHFVNREEDLLSVRSLHPISLKENKSFSLLFQSSDPHARFFMDGLDTLPEGILRETGSGDVYLPCSKEPYTLFSNDYYPLIPGFYRIKITANGEDFYSLIRIIPKQVTLEQWELMRDELESALSGLAQDILPHSGGGPSFHHSLPIQQLQPYLILQKRFTSITTALHDLFTKMNYRIEKNYHMVPEDRVKKIDEKTIRYHLQHPEDMNYLKTPVHCVKYDLPENQWVKKIVLFFIKMLTEFITVTHNQKIKLSNEINVLERYAAFQNHTQALLKEKKEVYKTITDYQNRAEKMMHSLKIVQSTDWFHEVSTGIPASLPSVMILDSRYRTLYQTYRECKNNTLSIKVDESYSTQWKRTDQLYELWGFLKITQLLYKKLHFEPQGWIFSQETNGKELLIPTLLPGTKISYQKGDVKLHLIYDSQLPFVSEETSLYETPIFTVANHNRPDGRIDVYYKEDYYGSLIFDFKYRPKKYFWDETKINSRHRTDIMRQLISYSSSCKSKFLFGGKMRGLTMHINPIQEVWGFYPSSSGVVDEPEIKEDHNIRILQLSPGMDDEPIVKDLEKVINEIVHRF